ncbi:MAG: ketopantoate reductase family protein [Candidatus Omnitrophica bacterium]|nr:ketopantoate reductase family protein [Candidatus Omnitrophota bacterium]
MAKIAILGPGGVGGFFACILARAGYQIVCVSSAETSQVIKENGLSLRSPVFGDYSFRPETVTQLETPVDLLLVTVKAPYLNQALGRIAGKFLEKGLVLPFLNGFEHLQMCRTHFGSRVAAGSISIESFWEGPGKVFNPSPHSKIEVATKDSNVAGLLTSWVESFKKAGLTLTDVGSEAKVVWGKLARLNAIACTTAAAQKSVGFIRSNPEWRDYLVNCLTEGSAVAEKDGVVIDEAATMAFIDKLPEGLSTSLQRDVAKGGLNELDAIAGAILRKAAGYGMKCPAIAQMIERIKLVPATVSF